MRTWAGMSLTDPKGREWRLMFVLGRQAALEPLTGNDYGGVLTVNVDALTDLFVTTEGTTA